MKMDVLVVSVVVAVAPHGAGAPPPLLPPCPFTSLSIALFYFSPFPFLMCFTYFLLLSIPFFFSTRIVPLCFPAGGRRRRPSLSLFVLILCYLHFLVVNVGVLLYLV